MADRQRFDVASAVTTAFETSGAAAVAVGLGVQTADLAGTGAGLVAGGLAAVAASWVFTGGPARARAAARAWRAQRALKRAAREQLARRDAPLVVPEPAVLPAARRVPRREGGAA